MAQISNIAVMSEAEAWALLEKALAHNRRADPRHIQNMSVVTGVRP